MTMQNQLIRLPQVRQHSARSRSTIYAQVAAGEFTPPIKIGARAVAWPLAEIEALNAARIAGKTTDEIKVLVAQLVAARKGGSQ
jgi:prophage regulatory protein